MEYRNIINLLDESTNQPSTLRTRNWVKMNDESRRTYNENSQIKFKTTMIRLNLRVYSNAYIHVKVTTEVMHRYMLKELQKFETLEQQQLQIIEIMT